MGKNSKPDYANIMRGDDDVPTTEDVRAHYAWSASYGTDRDPMEDAPHFDAWLAAHDAEVTRGAIQASLRRP
jgi:hypothetical protein